MKMSIIAASAIAFVAASVSAIDPAGAITFWGPTTPTQINNYLDTSTTIVGDFAQVRASVLGGVVYAFMNANQGPFVNQAQVNCLSGAQNAQSLNGTNIYNANITLFCPWFTPVASGQGSIQSN
jgi:type 1 fimbria pilin